MIEAFLPTAWNKWICKKLGHKEGWWPSAPWRCERCGEDFKEEWDRDFSEEYYARFEKDRETS